MNDQTSQETISLGVSVATKGGAIGAFALYKIGKYLEEKLEDNLKNAALKQKARSPVSIQRTTVRAASARVGGSSPKITPLKSPEFEPFAKKYGISCSMAPLGKDRALVMFKGKNRDSIRNALGDFIHAFREKGISRPGIAKTLVTLEKSLSSLPKSPVAKLAKAPIKGVSR